MGQAHARSLDEERPVEQVRHHLVVCLPELSGTRQDDRRPRPESLVGRETRCAWQRPPSRRAPTRDQPGLDLAVRRGRGALVLRRHRAAWALRRTVQRPVHRKDGRVRSDAVRLEDLAIGRRSDANPQGRLTRVVPALELRTDAQATAHREAGELVEQMAPVAHAESPVGTRVLPCVRLRPEVQLGKASVVQADGVAEVGLLAVGVEDPLHLPEGLLERVVLGLCGHRDAPCRSVRGIATSRPPRADSSPAPEPRRGS
jgi:hypothetical protein